jgi:hypothetical protein
MDCRLRLLVPAVLAAVALVGAAAEAGEPLADLLGQIKPSTAPEGSVAVMGWVERNEGRSELVRIPASRSRPNPATASPGPRPAR